VGRRTGGSRPAESRQGRDSGPRRRRGTCSPARAEPKTSEAAKTAGIIDHLRRVTLSSQAGSGGAAPSFALSVDTNLLDGTNPITANCFGAFGIQLSSIYAVVVTLDPMNPTSLSVADQFSFTICP